MQKLKNTTSQPNLKMIIPALKNTKEWVINKNGTIRKILAISKYIVI